jgi:hypothetical protein
MPHGNVGLVAFYARIQIGLARQSRWESRDNQDENAPLLG